MMSEEMTGKPSYKYNKKTIQMSRQMQEREEANCKIGRMGAVDTVVV